MYISLWYIHPQPINLVELFLVFWAKIHRFTMDDSIAQRHQQLRRQDGTGGQDHLMPPTNRIRKNLHRHGSASKPCTPGEHQNSW